MKKLFILIFLLIATNGYCSFLGEFEQGSDIFIWTQICNSDGSAATNPSVVWCSLFSKNDASAPTASASMVELNKAIPGLWKYEYKLVDFATGAAVARINATVTSRQPAGIHTFFVVDSGRGPNVRSILTTSDNIGINWADVSNPTTAVDLSATDIQLADTTTTVSNAVTVGTNNDKTGYSIAEGQFEPVLTEIEGLQQTQGTMYASLETVNTNVTTANTNITTVMGYTDTLEASMSTVNRKQDKAQASLSTVITGVTVTTNNDKTGYSLVNPQTWNLTGNITGNLSGSVGSLTANNDKTGYSLGNQMVVLKDGQEGIKQTQGTMYASLETAMGTGFVTGTDSLEAIRNRGDVAWITAALTAVTLGDTSDNQRVIAGAMRNVNVASAEAVYGSVVQKIDDAAATGELVHATIPTIRAQFPIVINEIRKNR